MKKRFVLLIMLLMMVGLSAWAAESEPYAVYNDGTLTFYYDGLRSSRTGTAYDLTTYQNLEPKWLENKGTITKAIFDISFANARPTYTREWFHGCSFMTEIVGINNLNTSNVEDMGWMFAGCTSLGSLDVSNFNTINVTSMYEMFYNCSSLLSLDVSKFDTKNVKIMERMFQGCCNLTNLDVSGLNTGRVTNMCNMFYGCSNLTSLDVSKFDTSNVKDMWGMFKDCNNLTSVDVSKFDTKNVTRMNSMFSGCTSLTILDVSKFDTKNVTSMNSMFSGCSSLTILDVGNFNTANVTDMYSMFGGCNNLISLDVSNFDTRNVTNMSGMFTTCTLLTNLDVSNFETKNVKNMGRMFSFCSGLTNLCLNNFDTSNVTNMREMFADCGSLKSLDVSCFNTANVTEFTFLFYDCDNLTNLIMGNQFVSTESSAVDFALSRCSKLSKVTFNGDIPTSINAKFFEGVGTLSALVTLEVPEQYKANYQAKFDGNKFYGGYFTLGTVKDGDTFTAKTKEGVEMTFKIISTEDKTCQVGSGEEASVDVATPGQVTIPQVANGYKVIAIGDKGFYNCAELTHIWLHEGIESIGELAFYGCSKLRVLDIPHSVTRIADDAFEGCSNVTISIPVDRVTLLPSAPGSSIKVDVKAPSTESISELERIFIPWPVTSIGERSFSNCSSVKVIEVDTKNEVFDSRENCNAIIRTADNTLLYGCQHTVIPATVKAIAQFAFEGHSKLQRIEIPADVVGIGGSAFSGCAALKSVTSRIVTPFAIDDNTFDENTYQTATLYVPYGTTNTYKNTDGWKNFFNIEELPASEEDETITFVCDVAEAICLENWDGNGDGKLSKAEAAAVTDINGVFSNTEITSLDELRYFTGLSEIKSFAFSECKKLTRITLPNGVKNIGQNAFVGNVNLEHVTFPDNDGFQLGIHPFQRCLSLTTIMLPKNLTWMMGNPFTQCSNLKEINVDTGNQQLESIDGVVFSAGPSLVAYPNGKELEEYTIPDGTASILVNAFSYSNKLKKVNIPASVVSIGSSAFNSCNSLISVELPSDLETLGSEAFNYTNLTTVISNDATPFEIANNVFSTETYQSAILFVPAGSKSLYQSASAGGWQMFQNIVEMAAEKGDVNGDEFVDEDDLNELAKEIMSPSEEYDATKDVNHDGMVDVKDIVEEVNIIKDMNEKSETGVVKQANSFLKARLTNCLRGGGKLAFPNTYVFLTFTLKNVSNQDFGEVKVGHTDYHNMEGLTDAGDAINNVHITDGLGDQYYSDVTVLLQAGDTKSMIILIKNVPTTAKSLTLQVGMYCEAWEEPSTAFKFIDVPIKQ